MFACGNVAQCFRPVSVAAGDQTAAPGMGGGLGGAPGAGRGGGTISRYFTSLSCPVCEELTNSGLCGACGRDKQRAELILGRRIHDGQLGHAHISQVDFALAINN